MEEYRVPMEHCLLEECLKENPNLEEVESLLIKGTNPNVISAKDGFTDYLTSPLAEAVTNGNKDLIKLLISYGADVNMQMYDSFRILDLAQDFGIKKLLFKYGVDCIQVIEVDNSFLILKKAINEKNIAVIEECFSCLEEKDITNEIRTLLKNKGIFGLNHYSNDKEVKTRILEVQNKNSENINAKLVKYGAKIENLTSLINKQCTDKQGMKFEKIIGLTKTKKEVLKKKLENKSKNRRNLMLERKGNKQNSEEMVNEYILDDEEILSPTQKKYPIEFLAHAIEGVSFKFSPSVSSANFNFRE